MVKHYPGLLTVLGHVWLVLLAGSVLLLLLTGLPRLLLAGAFVCGHLGMLLTMRLGIFPLVAVAALLVFFPPVFWDRASAFVAAWSDGIGRTPCPRRPLQAANGAGGRAVRLGGRPA